MDLNPPASYIHKVCRCSYVFTYTRNPFLVICLEQYDFRICVDGRHRKQEVALSDGWLREAFYYTCINSCSLHLAAWPGEQELMMMEGSE